MQTITKFSPNINSIFNEFDSLYAELSEKNPPKKLVRTVHSEDNIIPIMDEIENLYKLTSEKEPKEALFPQTYDKSILSILDLFEDYANIAYNEHRECEKERVNYAIHKAKE